MIVCTKQHLCNIWSSIYEKVKQHWGWAEKKALLIKSFYFFKSENPVKHSEAGK